MSDKPSDDELWVRALMTLLLCAAFLIAMGIYGCYYEKAVLPQRMAEKGYCQVTGLAKDLNGTTYAAGIWRPCNELTAKPKVE